MCVSYLRLVEHRILDSMVTGSIPVENKDFLQNSCEKVPPLLTTGPTSVGTREALLKKKY